MLSRSRVLGNLSVSFAVYGTLHAAALEFSRSARRTLWQSGVFILLAAILTLINLNAALFALRHVAGGSGNPGRTIGICSFAAAGALAYGMLVRRSGVSVLTGRALVAIAGTCACAAALALITASSISHAGPWLVAALWWWGFSSALWYVDRPQ